MLRVIVDYAIRGGIPLGLRKAQHDLCDLLAVFFVGLQHSADVREKRSLSKVVAPLIPCGEQALGVVGEEDELFVLLLGPQHNEPLKRRITIRTRVLAKLLKDRVESANSFLRHDLETLQF